MNRNFTYALLGFILSLSPLASFATHIMGFDMSYECIGTCTYRIYSHVYYDCTGSATQSWIPVGGAITPTGTSEMSGFNIFANVAGCNPPTPIGAWVDVSFTEVTPICPSLYNSPNHPTGCLGSNNPIINGSVEAIFYRDYDFCSVNCDVYQIAYDNCCRNGAITSLTGPSGNGIYSDNFVIDLTINPCNSSPRFIDPVSGNSVPPIAYICEGQLSTFNQGAYDPDGDSLSYELGSCFQGNANEVSYDYLNGYAPLTPLGPTWDVTINPRTGDLTFTPSPTGAVEVGVVCIVVKEWRNGVQIGSVVRDMQVTVLPAGLCPFPNPATGGVQNVAVQTSNGTSGVNALGYDQVAVCAGSEICFEIPTISQDTSLDYTMYWNGNLVGGTFTDALNPAITDTVRGKEPVARFCWTPAPGLRGTYFFVLTVKDDACPVPGTTQFTIAINVFDGEASYTTAYDRINCNEVELAVVPKSIIPGYTPQLNTIEWYGNGNLEYNPNTTDSAFIHYYPAPDTYFYSVFIEDELGCATTLTGIVPLNTGAIADAGQDITICSNLPFNLGTPSIAGQTYSWTPSANLSSGNVAQPDFAFANNSDTTAVFDYVLTVSDSICTTYDYLTVSVNAAVEAQIAPASPTVCFGDSITLTAVPNIGTASSTQFLWSTGDTTETIRVAPSINTTYTVVIFSDSAGGCASLPKDIEVVVTAPPVANITGDSKVCPDATTTLTASGGSSYIWSTGQTGSTISFSNVITDTTLSVIPIDANGCQGVPDSITLSPDAVPVAFFDNNIACEGGLTEFADGSTVPTGNVAGWEWSFGDGSTSSQETPTHTYDNPGAYFVNLTVTSDNGCTDSYMREVVVSPSPDVAFDATNVCEGLANQFTSTTTIPNPGTIAQYYWTYGDGIVDSGFQVTHTYESFGYYNVELNTVSGDGCAAKTVKTVFVHPNPEADFALESACADSGATFFSQSSVAGDLDYIAEWDWDFGEDPADPNNFSSSIHPVHAYGNAGTYNVSLTVTTDKGCRDQTFKEVVIYPHPQADYVYDQACEDVVTNFTSSINLGPGTEVLNYSWDFGNGMQVEGPGRVEASMKYKENGGAGVYTVQLVVTATGNCKDTISKEVIINPEPLAGFQSTNVCLYDSTEFRNDTKLASGSLSSWVYEFGDGSSTFGPNPNHLYFEPGRYAVTLTVISDSGCIDNVTEPVYVFEVPEFSLLQDDTVCFGDQARLLAVSDPDFELTWHLDKTSDEVVNSGPSFITAPMPFTTTYYAQASSKEGCVSDRVPVTAFVRSPEGYELYVSDSALEMPLAIANFSVGTTVGIDSYSWTFGDGNTSTASNPSHEYSAPGLYRVKVNLVDEYGCEMSLEDELEVKRISAIATASAFTPNNDGINETFFVKMHNVSNFQVKIFSRTGQLVYESSDPTFEWNGTQEGKDLQEGVYVYMVSGNDLDGNKVEEIGTITLLR
jgi:gliding motility-associated-like protein